MVYLKSVNVKRNAKHPHAQTLVHAETKKHMMVTHEQRIARTFLFNLPLFTLQSHKRLKLSILCERVKI